MDCGILFYMKRDYFPFGEKYASIFRSEIPEDEGNIFLRNVNT
jgi:hypothetical protein